MENFKHTRQSVFLIIILLLLFSCSEDHGIENTNIISQENFVELSQAKEVVASANVGNILKRQFYYSSANWDNTVINNLNSNRPVILSGDNGISGHMWVCDGYSQTSYYFDNCMGGTFILFST